MWRIDGQQWTVLHELLAITAERIDVWGLYQARLGTPQKYAGHLPTESLGLPRPGDAVAQKDGAVQRDEVITDPALIAQFFN